MRRATHPPGRPRSSRSTARPKDARRDVRPPCARGASTGWEGIVTFDRRGEGESTGDSSRGHFELEARDALAVVDALAVERVGLWGYSQGGWVAPLAATMSERVAFVVGVASTGVMPSARMMYATAQQLVPWLVNRRART